MARNLRKPFVVDHRGLPLELTYKDIATLRMRVQPVTGAIRISVPLRVDLATVRRFVDANLTWITDAQRRMRAVAPAPQPVQGDHVALWGREHEVVWTEAPRASSRLDADGVVRLAGPDAEGQVRALEALYRRELGREAPRMLARWQPVVGREAGSLKLRRMKTRWGTCNVRTKAVTLNLALAERDPSLLEYVVVHELTHLHVPDHGPRFEGRMDDYLPDWRHRRATINARPV